MKFQINREKLLKSISFSFNGIENKPAIPVWSNFLVVIKDRSINIFTRNSSLQTRTRLSIDFDGEISFVVPARVFLETVKNINSEEIIISVEEKEAGNLIKINAVGKRTSVKISSEKPNTFTVIDGSEVSEAFEMKAQEFTSIMTQCSLFCNEKDVRIFATGISIRNHEDNIEFASSDGYIISRFLVKSDVKIKNILIPKNTGLLSHIIGEEGLVKISTSDRFFCISNGSVEIIALTLSAEFPQINQFWEAEFKENKYVSLDKADILEAIKLMGIYSNSQSNLVKISLEGDELTFSSSSIDKGNEAEHIVQVENSNMSNFATGFNLEFINRCLGCVDSGDVKLYFCGDKKPLFLSDNKDINKSFFIQSLSI